LTNTRKKEYWNKNIIFIFVHPLIFVNIFACASTSGTEKFFKQEYLFFVHYFFFLAYNERRRALLPVGGTRVQAYRVNRRASTNSTYV